MSNPSEFELDLDLQLLPAWARQPAQENKYARYEGETDDAPRGRGPRPGRGDREGGFRRDRRPPSERRDRPPREGGGGPKPAGPPGERRPFRGRDDRGRGPRREFRREPSPEEVRPLVPVDITFVPDPKGVESLARQIKLTGRAYPLFEIATLIMGKPDRFNHEFKIKRGPDGKPLQRLLVCSLDESLWLTEEEVAQHVLRHHFATFYQVERVPTDPPKGTYTFVAQCGITGTLLGPPNLHEYPEKLRKLHAERCASMPFEVFKSRVKFVREEAVVKQWIEEQSYKNEYTCLNVPEPLKLTSRDQLEAHFRNTHLANLTREVEAFVIPAAGPRRVLAPELSRALRVNLEQQRRFPIRVATILSQQFASHGLHFFKVNKTVTHVCVSRPHYLDLTTTSVSDGVRKIVEFIAAKPGCSRKMLLETLAPTPPAPPAPPLAPVPPPPPSAEPVAETAPEPGAEPAAAPTPTPEASAAPAAAEPKTPAANEPTPEQRAVIGDLHWLIHQGHVIEFSSGRMEMAKKPLPKPPPPPKPVPTPAPPAAAATAATPSTEALASPAPETPAASAATAESPRPEGEPTASPPIAPAESAPAPTPEAASSEPPPAADI